MLLVLSKTIMKISRKDGILCDCSHRDVIRLVVLVSTIIWIFVALDVFRPRNQLNISSIMNRNLYSTSGIVDQSGKSLLIHIECVSQKPLNVRVAQTFTVSYHRQKDYQLNADVGEKAAVIKVPLSAEWRYVRTPQKSVISPDLEPESVPTSAIEEGQRDHKEILAKDHQVKAAYLLSWPPVGKDGNIPSDEGSDTMPLTGLKVPRFWEALPGSDLNKVGTKVNGFETIFLMIASYRDFQCRETIASAFNRSDHPERLYVGAVDQLIAGDIGCLDVEIPCSVDPNQPLCKYRDQISIYKMDAKFSTG